MKKYREILWIYLLILVFTGLSFFVVSERLSNVLAQKIINESQAPKQPSNYNQQVSQAQDKKLQNLETDLKLLKQQIEDKFGLTNVIISWSVGILSAAAALLTLLSLFYAISIFFIKNRIINQLSKQIEEKFEEEVNQIIEGKKSYIKETIESLLVQKTEEAKQTYENQVNKLIQYLQLTGIWIKQYNMIKL